MSKLSHTTTLKVYCYCS